MEEIKCSICGKSVFISCFSEHVEGHRLDQQVKESLDRVDEALEGTAFDQQCKSILNNAFTSVGEADKMKKFKEGDKVRMLEGEVACYHTGDIGTLLIAGGSDGYTYRVDFNGHGNERVYHDGIWYTSLHKFERYEEDTEYMPTIKPGKFLVHGDVYEDAKRLKEEGKRYQEKFFAHVKAFNEGPPKHYPKLCSEPHVFDRIEEEEGVTTIKPPETAKEIKSIMEQSKEALAKRLVEWEFEPIDDSDWYDQTEKGEFENPLAALRDVLPDVYGREEHEKRMAEARLEKEFDEADVYCDLAEKLSCVMHAACGDIREDEALEEPKKPVEDSFDTKDAVFKATWRKRDKQREEKK